MKPNPHAAWSIFLVTLILWTGIARAADPPENLPEGMGEFEMVLIHGLGADSKIWDPLLPYLQGTFRVRTFELAGHGETQPIQNPSIDLETERLAAFLQEEGFTYPTLVGHGLGGMIALKYTIENPSGVHRLIMMDAAPKQLADQQTKEMVGRQLVEDYDRFVATRYMSMSLKEDITELILDKALRTHAATFVSLLMSSFDFDETAELYTMPVPMLVVGSEMMFPTDDSSKHLLQHYGFGDARTLSFKRIGGAGHYMMLENPVQTVSVLLAFGVSAEYYFDR